ncbi:MAG: hypothetical protein J5649_03925 [Lachnospiraceae bacterium]|nr:hypothetical protein [Lachnospiraceae bacterium]
MSTMEGNTNVNPVPGQNPAGQTPVAAQATVAGQATAAGQGQEKEQEAKKRHSKKPLIAILAAALLGLGAYGGMEYYNSEKNKTPEVTQEAVVNKEKVEITVNGTDVQINGQKMQLAEGQNWQKYIAEYFAKKDLAKTEVIVDVGYADQTVKEEITSALSALNINPTMK